MATQFKVVAKKLGDLTPRLVRIISIGASYQSGDALIAQIEAFRDRVMLQRASSCPEDLLLIADSLHRHNKYGMSESQARQSAKADGDTLLSQPTIASIIETHDLAGNICRWDDIILSDEQQFETLVDLFTKQATYGELAESNYLGCNDGLGPLHHVVSQGFEKYYNANATSIPVSKEEAFVASLRVQVEDLVGIVMISQFMSNLTTDPVGIAYPRKGRSIDWLYKHSTKLDLSLPRFYQLEVKEVEQVAGLILRHGSSVSVPPTAAFNLALEMQTGLLDDVIERRVAMRLAQEEKERRLREDLLMQQQATLLQITHALTHVDPAVVRTNDMLVRLLHEARKLIDKLDRTPRTPPGERQMSVHVSNEFFNEQNYPVIERASRLYSATLTPSGKHDHRAHPSAAKQIATDFANGTNKLPSSKGLIRMETEVELPLQPGAPVDSQTATVVQSHGQIVMETIPSEGWATTAQQIDQGNSNSAEAQQIIP